jgi:hypothetical protein
VPGPVLTVVTATVTAVLFTPDAHTLVAVGGQAQLWDVADYAA